MTGPTAAKGTFPYYRAAGARRPRHNARGERMIDLFAEALSETGDVPAAARLVGISYDYGRVLLKRIRNELGEQAR